MAGVLEKPFLDLVGDFCKLVKRFPPSASISAGLEKQDEIPAAFGCFSDTWRGKYWGTLAAIKTYRAYPAQEDVRSKRD
jgi:hypothetical protein